MSALNFSEIAKTFGRGSVNAGELRLTRIISKIDTKTLNKFLNIKIIEEKKWIIQAEDYYLLAVLHFW